MPNIFNENNIEYKRKSSPLPEYEWLSSKSLSELAKSKQTSVYMRSLDPGKYSYPYHYHLNSEEIMVVMFGRMMLRSPEGFVEVKQGDVVFFETGKSGAHQFHNHTGEPCKYLDIRINVDLDVCHYPDTGKVNILNEDIFYKGKDADYFEGEEKVSEKWEDRAE